MTGPQILEMNGFKWSEIGDQAPVIQKQLLEDNAKEYWYTPVTQSHPKMALLDKYLYKKGTGVKEEKSVTSTDDMCRNTTDANAVLDACGGASSAGSSGDGVKQESLDWLSFEQKRVHLRGVVAGMQKCTQQGAMLVCKFEVASRTDEALKIKGAGLKAMMSTLESVLANAMLHLSEVDMVKVGDEGLKDQGGKIEALVRTAEHHIGGYKEMYKRHQAMLGS